MSEKEILAKALDMINEKGYAQVGMREIARELDISPGNLTYYFKKKEDLLVSLLHQFSTRNTQIIESYLPLERTNANFLRLMHQIFENQFMYRGVYVGNQFFPVVVLEKKIFDYQGVVTKRMASYREFISSLGMAGQLKIDEEDVTFLLSYITLFGRFWITEATLFDKSPNKDEVIQHYLTLLAKQLSLFSTQAGIESIEAYGRGI